MAVTYEYVEEAEVVSAKWPYPHPGEAHRTRTSVVVHTEFFGVSDEDEEAFIEKARKAYQQSLGGQGRPWKDAFDEARNAE